MTGELQNLAAAHKALRRDSIPAYDYTSEFHRHEMELLWSYALSPVSTNGTDLRL